MGEYLLGLEDGEEDGDKLGAGLLAGGEIGIGLFLEGGVGDGGGHGFETLEDGLLVDCGGLHGCGGEGGERINNRRVGCNFMRIG